MTEDAGLIKLLTKIHDEKGMDFTQYKDRSLARRIASRMNKRNIISFEEYIRLIDQDPHEYAELINAMTINVTEFFRNPEIFENIENIVIPNIVYSKVSNKRKIIRAWSCGCSSGDEPYSLAMLFLEKLGSARDNFLLTVIGSDVDKEALEEARKMVYTRERLRAVSVDLLDKYFEKADGSTYKLKTMISNTVHLRYNDIVKDKPYMFCDLILCRNLLIYFNKQLQEETILKFYECLNPGGYLVLGLTETLAGSAANMFEPVNNRLRIYRKPEKQTFRAEKLLTQDEIDRIVNGLLEK